MSHFLRKYGDWAFVAGGAMGLGAAYCRLLAASGFNIILVDILDEEMRKLAREITDQYNVEVIGKKLDLSQDGVEKSILSLIEKKKCRLFVYNAAYGPVKKFTSNTTSELDYYLNVNCRTLLKLLHEIAKDKQDSLKSGFLIMSSLAGIWGTQLVAPYAATKAFDLGLGEALHYELKNKNIDVTVCCAGATDTPNYRSTNPQYGLLRPNVLAPEKVAAEALKYLGKGPVCIPGFSNKLTYVILNHLLPRKWALKLMNNTMGGMYAEKKQ